jgi:hypothetical protein
MCPFPTAMEEKLRREMSVVKTDRQEHAPKEVNGTVPFGNRLGCVSVKVGRGKAHVNDPFS